MATKLPAKPHRTPLQEAGDPTTDPERLRRLVVHNDEAVHRAAWRNPSLPEDAWRTALLAFNPEAWANPMAPFYLLAWTPQEEDLSTLEDAARWATQALWREPERCSPEGKALLAAKVQEWWATSEDISGMIWFLGYWSNAIGNGSQEHREAVRIIVLCLQTNPHPTSADLEAIEILEAWSQGREDRRKEAKALHSSWAIQDATKFALDNSVNPWIAVSELLKTVASDKRGQERQEAITAHERLLADVIRQAMPLPPVVA
jgi:hypothetical protein